MTDLSNMYALQAGQQKHDYANPHDVPIRGQTFQELLHENMELRDYFVQLTEAVHEAVEWMNRVRPAGGARLARICEELELKAEQL